MLLFLDVLGIYFEFVLQYISNMKCKYAPKRCGSVFSKHQCAWDSISLMFEIFRDFCVSVHSLHFSFSVALFHSRSRNRSCSRSISSCLFLQRLTTVVAAKKAIHNNRWYKIFKILWTVVKKSNKIEITLPFILLGNKLAKRLCLKCYGKWKPSTKLEATTLHVPHFLHFSHGTKAKNQRKR